MADRVAEAVVVRFWNLKVVKMVAKRGAKWVRVREWNGRGGGGSIPLAVGIGAVAGGGKGTICAGTRFEISGRRFYHNQKQRSNVSCRWRTRCGGDGDALVERWTATRHRSKTQTIWCGEQRRGPWDVCKGGNTGYNMSRRFSMAAIVDTKHAFMVEWYLCTATGRDSIEAWMKKAMQAEEDVVRGRTKLRQAGKQIQSVINSAYKIERQARGLKDVLRELPSRESARFRTQVNNVAKEAKKERNALSKEVTRISNHGISV
ncbi:UNVERIFIED_CONTAM: hypothetical protein Scaly_1781300 [Sesamum calycinum]|uniref:Uncharacterized protein n=1 Tax=Sesamum calycinum TaxID=2727403 RepID=A0AAW2NWE7_9LAMI